MEQLRTSELALRGMTALRIGHALLASKQATEVPPRRVYSHEQVSARDVFLLSPQEGLASASGTSTQGKQGVLTFGHVHSQALGQCRRYLRERYPDTEIVQVNSTAKAAQEAAQDPEGLAVCSYKCAEVYDLRVVDRDIQDAGESEFAVPCIPPTSRHSTDRRFSLQPTRLALSCSRKHPPRSRMHILSRKHPHHP